jgi:hypothetical protein
VVQEGACPSLARDNQFSLLTKRGKEEASYLAISILWVVDISTTIGGLILLVRRRWNRWRSGRRHHSG